MAAGTLLLIAAPRKAAACGINCPCVALNHIPTNALIVAEHMATRAYIQQQFQTSRSSYWTGLMFTENILSALRGISEQLINTTWLDVMAIGAFFDAKNQMETQRQFQEMAARAHKDYHPDMELCTLGTASRSLGPAYRKAELAAHILAERTRDRMLDSGHTMAADGRGGDKMSRFRQLRAIYCEPQEHYHDMGMICTLNGASETINRDIDYTRTIAAPLTLTADFDNTANNDEPHIFAMAANLYGNDSMPLIPQDYFREPRNHPAYLEIREIAAKRNVAANSFDNIVGMKISGTREGEQISQFVARALQQMGFSENDSRIMLRGYVGGGPGGAASYNALMEIMNKTLYERPEFYINLYTKPANIDRIGATIRAANLMQDSDRYKSQLRMEMNLSQILELEINEMQTAVQGEADKLRGTGLLQSTQPQ